ncbi:interferon a3-like [Salvelinus fontinalis]|uniref:interferon a3-like n=1 Tax=Salvelinus fontinalis TaxID=8038 RepID=UPI00248527F7|nr:interferon a3-like [Salvelinus fontinalis]
MGSISFWMCLVMTICTWNKTIGCTWMRTLPRSPSMFQVFSNNTITMLQKMGHEVSRESQIPFPDKQYRKVNNFKADEQMAFISHTLNAIKKLYSSGKYESTAWDQKGVDKFMNDLYRQTSELVKAMKTSQSKSVERVNKNMSLHFKFLKNYLKREDYSASGWEDIRTVVLAHLQRLDTTLSSQ